MKKAILKIAIMSLAAAAIAVVPTQVLGQETKDKPATGKNEPSKTHSLPFHGNVAAIDKTAKTLTVGKSTYVITSATKIFKADKPAVLDDGAVGEPVSGSYRKSEDGKFVAIKITFEAKANGKKDGAAKKDNK